MDNFTRAKAIADILESKGYAAIVELIDKCIEDATEIVVAPSVANNHGQIAHAAGGLSWLRHLKVEIIAHAKLDISDDGPITTP